VNECSKHSGLQIEVNEHARRLDVNDTAHGDLYKRLNAVAEQAMRRISPVVTLAISVLCALLGALATLVVLGRG